MVDSGHCAYCGEDRPLTSFTRDRRRNDGLAFYGRDHARHRLRESKLPRTGPLRTRHLLHRVVPEGSRWCPDCDTVEPVVEFPRSSADRTGRHTYCLPCHDARGRASLEEVGGSRTYQLERWYGISAEDADEMLEAQGGLYAICKVDDDHETGGVRALPGFNRNGGFGRFKDDPFLLRLAGFNVEHHSERRALATLQAAFAAASEAADRPGAPPVGSQRHPGTRSTSSRSTGRSSGARRRRSAGEADQ
jgi:hypothetical protein